MHKWYIAHDTDQPNTLGPELIDDVGDGQRSVELLAARHGHGIVEEDFVRHVDTRSDGLTDSQQARVEIRTVA